MPAARGGCCYGRRLQRAPAPRLLPAESAEAAAPPTPAVAPMQLQRLQGQGAAPPGTTRSISRVLFLKPAGLGWLSLGLAALSTRYVAVCSFWLALLRGPAQSGRT